MKRKNRNNYDIKKIITLVIGICIAISVYFNSDNINNSKNIISNTVNVSSYDLENVPPYNNEPYSIINNNIPNFTEEDLQRTSFENYSELDELGRCGVAFANLSKETMPKDDEKRESISNIEPSGWQSKQYSKEVVNGKYLYNRCHLIAYKLSAENDNEKNLITGTRYFNTNGMLPFELKVINYLSSNEGKHVLYRVTPVFENNNLVASGVQMEAESVEDNGASICFNVYIYNVQPGIEIDYKTGDSKLND